MTTLPIHMATTVPELSTAMITFTAKDEAGAAIPGSDLDSLTVTLFEKESGEVINSRERADILGANGGSVDEDGVGVWIMEPEDNAIVLANRSSEEHIALFEWGWNAGGRQGKATVRIVVQNLAMVPQAS